ncbi:MAG: FHA domain-containing protein [Halobacteriovoraceae bacterium]|nr:FHA domain-containing protein [Halobacteriovoraceae bacterium]
MAIKLIVQNEDQHFKFELSEESIILGRSKSCDIQIKDSLVSGKHCIVTLVNGKASVSDIGTTNGTFLNESPIEACRIHLEDVITIGNTSLTIDTESLTQEEMLLHSNRPKTKITKDSMKREGDSQIMKNIRKEMIETKTRIRRPSFVEEEKPSLLQKILHPFGKKKENKEDEEFEENE